eukprot:2682287-Rhodomonas_salina.4
MGELQMEKSGYNTVCFVFVFLRKSSFELLFCFLSFETRPLACSSKVGGLQMVLVGGGVAALAGGYFGVQNYKKRQQGLVEEFAYSQILYWGDAEGSKVNVKEYLGRVGPLINTFHRCLPPLPHNTTNFLSLPLPFQLPSFSRTRSLSPSHTRNFVDCFVVTSSPSRRSHPPGTD